MKARAEAAEAQMAYLRERLSEAEAREARLRAAALEFLGLDAKAYSYAQCESYGIPFTEEQAQVNTATARARDVLLTICVDSLTR